MESRPYLVQNVFAFWLGLASTVGGLVFFASPRIREATAIAHVAYHLDYAWTAMYLAGGLFTLHGIARLNLRHEVVGQVLLATAFVLSATALIIYRGWIAVPSALITYALASACLVRAHVLIHARRQIRVNVPPDR